MFCSALAQAALELGNPDNGITLGVDVAVGETVILLPLSPSLLKHLLTVEGGCSIMTVSPTARWILCGRLRCFGCL